jgi:serine/threonine protein kinase
VFAACVILFAFVTGSRPFHRATASNQFYKLIQSGEYSAYWNSLPYNEFPPTQNGGPPSIDDDLRNLFERSFCFAPEARLTIDELLAHPWMLGPVASPEAVKVFMAGIEAQSPRSLKACG